MQTSEFFERFRRGINPELPKHAQMREVILAAIEAGHWKQGERLPNENILTGMTPYSLGTVQRALRELVSDGLLERKQGAGSFVARSSRLLPYPLHCQFLDDSGEGILPIFSTTMFRGRAKAKGPWDARLSVNGGKILQIDRRIDVNHEFTIHSRFFASERDLGSLLKCPLRQLDGENFKLKIAKEMNLPITSISNRVRAQMLPDDIAESIEARKGTVGLHVEAIAMSGKRPIYMQDFFIPPTERMLMLTPSETK